MDDQESLVRENSQSYSPYTHYPEVLVRDAIASQGVYNLSHNVHVQDNSKSLNSALHSQEKLMRDTGQSQILGIIRQTELVQEKSQSHTDNIYSQTGFVQETPKSQNSDMTNNEERQVETLQDNTKSPGSDTQVKEELIRERIKCHGTFLSNGLYLLWTGELYCDCILIVDDKEIKCHSCVLASFSPLLQIKLNSVQNKTRLEYNRHMTLLDLTRVMIYTDLEPLIRYMYTGELCFKRTQVYGILKSAQFLGLKEIQQFCFIWMSQNITVKPSVVSLKVANPDTDSGDARVSSTETTLPSTVVTATDINEKPDEVDFQDYIDILNSWQRAATEDNPADVTEPVGQSIEMANDNTGGEILLHSLQLQSKDQQLSSIEAEPSVEVQDPIVAKSPEIMVGAQRRKFRKQPLRFSAGDNNAGKSKSEGFKPTDLLYVNFNNQKYLGPDDGTTARKHDRIVVILPSVSDQCDIKVKNIRKGTQPRKLVKRQRKYVSNADDTELNLCDDENNSDEGKNENPVKVKLKKRKGRPKGKKVLKGTSEIVIAIDGETHTCIKIMDKVGRMIYKCPKCNRPFKNLNIITQHLRNHKNNEISTCHICGHGFTRACDLSRHIRCHNYINCNHCEFATKSPKKFSVHNEKQHQVTKPFACTHEGCNFVTTKQHQLYNHMPIHSEIKPYKCIHCGKTCAHRSGLSSHLKSCLQKRDRLCDVCGQAFNHLESLKSHRRIHFGEKPYLCTECPARFSDHRNLKRHLTVHKKDGKIPPYAHIKVSSVIPPKTVQTKDREQPTIKTVDSNFPYIPQPFSIDPKLAHAVPGAHNNPGLNQKSTKVSKPDLFQGPQYTKLTEIGQPERNHGQYSHTGPFQESQRKLFTIPPAGSESLRVHEYQPNISLAHAQPPMTSGYNACLSPFSPLVPPDLHSFYSSQGLIPTGNPHPSITHSGGRHPIYHPQLQDYSIANMWKTTPEDLHSPLQNNPNQ